MVDFLHFFRENPLEIESLAKLVGQVLLRWADRFEHAEINIGIHINKKYRGPWKCGLRFSTVSKLKKIS